MKASKRDYQKLQVFLKKQLKENHIKGFALVGGLAVSAYSEPRATKDIDFLLSYEDNFSPEKLGQLYEVEGYRAQVSRSDRKDPLSGLVRIYDKKGNELFDLIPVYWKWQDEMIVDAHTIEVFDTIETPIVRVEDLIILKLVAGGPQDLLDVKALLRVAASSQKFSRDRLLSLAKRARVDKKLMKLMSKLEI